MEGEVAHLIFKIFMTPPRKGRATLVQSLSGGVTRHFAMINPVNVTLSSNTVQLEGNIIGKRKNF